MSTIAVGASILEGFSIFVVDPKQVLGKVVKGIYQAAAILVEKVALVVEIDSMQPIFVMDSNLPP